MVEEFDQRVIRFTELNRSVKRLRRKLNWLWDRSACVYLIDFFLGLCFCSLLFPDTKGVKQRLGTGHTDLGELTGEPIDRICRCGMMLSFGL